MSRRPREAAPFVTALVLCGTVAANGGPGPAGTDRTAAINGIEMSYTTMGAGDPLLLLHAGTQSGELIVHGDRDYCFPVSMAWEIRQAIPTSYLWVVPDGTHVPLSERDADTFTAAVLDFFSGSWKENSMARAQTK